MSGRTAGPDYLFLNPENLAYPRTANYWPKLQEMMELVPIMAGVLLVVQNLWTHDSSSRFEYGSKLISNRELSFIILAGTSYSIILYCVINYFVLRD